MYEKLDDIEKKYRISEWPLNVIIESCNYCNLNCITCANNSMTRPKGSMNILLYKKLIDEIAEVNPYTRIWLDFYGEPLLQKFKLYYMIDYAKKKGLKNIDLNTNATLLDKEMAEMLLDSGITYISTDCDGYSKEVYESIRVGADRDRFFENVEYLLQRKKERGLTTPIIEVKIMEMEENRHEIDKVMSYWRERGAWTAKRRLISWAGQCDTVSIDVPNNRIACGNAVGTMAITWDGKVVNCGMDINGECQLGDANVESIKEIWQRRNESLVRKHMEHKWDELPDICKGCNDWAIIGEERFDQDGQAVTKNYNNNEVML